jgi:hypothetical protein
MYGRRMALVETMTATVDQAPRISSDGDPDDSRHGSATRPAAIKTVLTTHCGRKGEYP